MSRLGADLNRLDLKLVIVIVMRQHIFRITIVTAKTYSYFL
jgi:hypothetical protein